jgi:DNA-binding NarL/FixJ family response regulator
MESKRPVRVLVIDDDSSLSEAILDALSSRGIFASSLRPTASSPPATIAGAAASLTPDVVLLDIVMPVDTAKLVEELRAHPKLERAVILGCSGHAALADEISHRLDGFLHKPFDTAELIEAVHEAMSMRRATPAKSKTRTKSSRSKSV